MKNGIRKAMPALVALLMTGLATPVSAGPADGAIDIINDLYVQFYHSVPDAAGKCPGPKTITVNNKAFYWTVDGARDPPGGEYLLASWTKTSQYGGSACAEVAFDCRVTIYALVARPMDIVNVTKDTFGKTHVEGTYRGLKFHGTTGACGTGTASFQGDIDFPVPLLAPFRHVTGQAF